MSKLTVRHPKIDVETMEMPDLWLGGDAYRTHVFNSLSMMFPIGEKYFMDSVRAALPLLDDAALTEDIRRFIGQEATHSRLHRVFNERLEQQGLRNRVEPIIAWRIRLTERLGVKHKLAVSMAYEHFTAIFGDTVLGPSGWLDGASEPMRALWQWHAVEECEHRAVVFEVYRAMGGGYLLRAGWFLYVALFFALDSTFQTFNNLYRSGHLFRLATWRQGARFMLGRQGVVAKVLSACISYLRPGFSPAEHGDKEAPRRWLEQNGAWFAG